MTIKEGVERKSNPHPCNLLGLCKEHAYYYCCICQVCPQCTKYCSCDNEKSVSPKSIFCKQCNYWYCAKCVGYPLCPKCHKDVLEVVKKRCGCEYDGTFATFCHVHKKWYCNKCSDGGCSQCVDVVVNFSKNLHALPDCPCMKDGVRNSTIALYCQTHKGWYCKGCSGICPKCKQKALQAVSNPRPSKFNPSDYPIVNCTRHGDYCSRCDRQCPKCDAKGTYWTLGECISHKTKYCVLCGLGCKQCGKKRLHGAVQSECPCCGETRLRDCLKHGYYCMNCDGRCQKCDGMTTYNGIQYHRCAKAMSYCSQHKKSYCAHCKQYCLLCAKEAKFHSCGQQFTVCKQHDFEWCPLCDGSCQKCEIERLNSVTNAKKHSCGKNLLYCAIHESYFCPCCDRLTECSVVCGVKDKFCQNDENYDHVTVEDKWQEFQTYLEFKDDLLDALDALDEGWTKVGEIVMPTLVNGGQDPTVEALAAQCLLVNRIVDDLKGIKEDIESTLYNTDSSYEDNEADNYYIDDKQYVTKIKITEFTDNTLLLKEDPINF